MTTIENPLNQFAIKTLIPIHIGKYDVSFTNSSLFMLVAFLLIVFLFFVGTSRKAVVPGRLQGAAEMLYEFTANMVEDNAGHGSAKYVPFVMSIFLVVLGVVPATPWGLPLIAAAAAVEVGESLFWVWLSKRKRATVGAEALIGRTARVVRPSHPEGYVRLQ